MRAEQFFSLPIHSLTAATAICKRVARRSLILIIPPGSFLFVLTLSLQMCNVNYMTTIQIRIDNKTKAAAQKVLYELGLDMTSAIQVYLKQISLHKRIPFSLVTANGLTPQEEQDIIAAAAEAKRGHNVTKPMSVKQAVAYLQAL